MSVGAVAAITAAVGAELGNYLSGLYGSPASGLLTYTTVMGVLATMPR